MLFLSAALTAWVTFPRLAPRRTFWTTRLKTTPIMKLEVHL